jgi:hypothetical protein
VTYCELFLECAQVLISAVTVEVDFRSFRLRDLSGK